MWGVDWDKLDDWAANNGIGSNEVNIPGLVSGEL